MGGQRRLSTDAVVQYITIIFIIWELKMSIVFCWLIQSQDTSSGFNDLCSADSAGGGP